MTRSAFWFKAKEKSKSKGVRGVAAVRTKARSVTKIIMSLILSETEMWGAPLGSH